MSKFRSSSTVRNSISEHEITEIVSVPERYSLITSQGIRFTICESATALGARFDKPSVTTHRNNLQTDE